MENFIFCVVKVFYNLWRSPVVLMVLLRTLFKWSLKAQPGSRKTSSYFWKVIVVWFTVLLMKNRGMFYLHCHSPKIFCLTLLTRGRVKILFPLKSPAINYCQIIFDNFTSFLISQVWFPHASRDQVLDFFYRPAEIWEVGEGDCSPLPRFLPNSIFHKLKKMMKR